MSTRANILITDGEGNKVFLYHHHDGYPEGVGRELQRIARHITDEINNVESLADFIMQQNFEYQPTDRIHGDINYLYVFDVANCSLYYEKYTFEEQNSLSDGVQHPLCTYIPIVGTKEAPKLALIREQLATIEKEHDIRILYAVESGSRAWGFGFPTIEQIYEAAVSKAGTADFEAYASANYRSEVK